MKIFKANDIHKKVIVPAHIDYLYPWDIFRWRSTVTDPGIRVQMVGHEIELRYESEYERDQDYNNLIKLMEEA